MISLYSNSLVPGATRWLRSHAATMLQSRFVRQVAVLVGGTTVSRILMVVAAPILTRLYHPADFGAFAVFFSVVTIAIMACAYNYEQSIAVPKEDKIAAGLVLWSFTLLFGNVVLIAILIVLLPSQLSKLFGAQNIANYLWLIPLSLLGGGTFYILNSWAIRMASFKTLSKRRIWQSAAQILVQFHCSGGSPRPPRPAAGRFSGTNGGQHDSAARNARLSETTGSAAYLSRCLERRSEILEVSGVRPAGIVIAHWSDYASATPVDQIFWTDRRRFL